MSMKVDFSQLERALKQLDNKVANKATKSALENGANVMMEAEKKTAPIDTGKLKASINKSNMKTSKGIKKIEIGLMKAPKDVQKYGYYQNYGFKGKGGLFWMEEAYAQGKQKSYEAIKNTLASEILK